MIRSRSAKAFNDHPAIPRRIAMLVLCLLVALTAAAGCNRHGANRGIVSGKVTLDGQPLEQGTIQFTPIEGTKGVPTGGSITSGRYRLADAAAPTVGCNRVEVRAMRPTGKKVPKPFAPPGETIDELVAAVPPKYNSQSTLKIEVKPGENTADFDITSE
jgi:hypothetical protein